MRWAFWRRSENVEDYTDPNKPVVPADLAEFAASINEMTKIVNSDLSRDAGSDDVLREDK